MTPRVCRVKHPLSWNISHWMEHAGLSSPWEPSILRLTANSFAFALKIPAFLGSLMSKNSSVHFHARQQWCGEAPWWVGGDHWSGLQLVLLFYPPSAHDAQKAAAELLCLSECSLATKVSTFSAVVCSLWQNESSKSSNSSIYSPICCSRTLLSLNKKQNLSPIPQNLDGPYVSLNGYNMIEAA